MTTTPEVANLSRRALVLGFAAGSFVSRPALSSPATAQEKKYAGDGMKGGIKEDPRLFLSVANDGTVNLLCIRAEMGQGIRTGWAWSSPTSWKRTWRRVKVLQAQGDEARYGNQDTDGSRSMRHHFLPLRRMAAAVRQMLEQEAATRWNVPVAEVKAQNHEVVHAASGRRLGFGALARCRGAARSGAGHAGAQGRTGSATSARTTCPDRQSRLHHRQGPVRHRCPPRRHGLCRRRPAAGLRRQGQELRRGRRR